jgi:hypothetical protein
MGTYFRPEVEDRSRLKATYVHVLTDGEMKMNGTIMSREDSARAMGQE